MIFHQYIRIMKALRFLLLTLIVVATVGCGDDDWVDYYQPRDFIDVKAYCERLNLQASSQITPDTFRFQFVCVYDEEASAARERENERVENEIWEYIQTKKPQYYLRPQPQHVYVIDDSVEEFKITADKTLFGIEAGGVLNSYINVAPTWYNAVISYPTNCIKTFRSVDDHLFMPIHEVIGPDYMLLYSMRFWSDPVPEYFDYDSVTITVYMRLTSGIELTESELIPFYN